jgi:hypothetical protein
MGGVGGLRIAPTAFFILRITAAICGGRGAGVFAPVWGLRLIAVMQGVEWALWFVLFALDLPQAGYADCAVLQTVIMQGQRGR